MVGLWITPTYVAAARISHVGIDQSFICPFQNIFHVPGPGLDTGVVVESRAAKAATLRKPTL